MMAGEIAKALQTEIYVGGTVTTLLDKTVPILRYYISITNEPQPMNRRQAG